MKYYADQWTDAELDALEKKIVAEYGKAGQEVKKKAQEYFRKFRAQDLEMLARLEDGEITEEYYRLWRMNQLGRGERWEKLADNLAQRVTATNMTASAYINDTTPGIYSFNHNYEAYSIEKVAANVSFTLMDEQTVKRLLMRRVRILPVTQVKERTDLSWNKRSLQKELLSGIMQGESIDKMAARFTHVTGMNRTSAVRNARTAVTGAQNAGRYTAISEANEMGCKAEKQWMATLDRRTRKSHQHMDLEHVPVEQQFSNGCMYPGDMDCRDGAEIYNCRCTMVSYLSPELMAEPMTRWTGEVDGNGDPVYVEDMSYDQWKSWKESTNSKQSVTISTEINRNSAAGKPQAIRIFGTDLNNRQRRLLERLPKRNSRIVVKKREATMKDLSALTAQTGVEYAMFTRGNERLIIKGHEVGVDIDVDEAKRLWAQGYKWSGHTHPGDDNLTLIASSGDYAILKEFHQESSVIYNSMGERSVFYDE